MDPEKLERAITPRTRVIQPVDLYGQTADMDPIRAIADRRGIPLLEDACQAIGASYGGRPAGALGTIAAFSFYPTKNLGAAGDAGAVTTADDALAEKVRILRIHGGNRQYHHEIVGGNFRIDALQAAVLHAKLPRLAGWNERRRAIARRYGDLLGDAARAREDRQLPVEAPRARHVYHQYVVRVRHRDAVKERLAREGISDVRLLSGPDPSAGMFRAGSAWRKASSRNPRRPLARCLRFPSFRSCPEEEVERVGAALRRAVLRDFLVRPCARFSRAKDARKTACAA